MTMKIEDLDRSQVVIGIVTILIVYKVYRSIKVAYLKKKFNVKEPKLLPGSYPFFSRGPLMMIKRKKEGTLLAYVVSFFRDYGKTWKANLGHTIIVTCEPENIKAILATQFNEFVMGLRHAHFKPLLGDGVFTLDGHGWKQSRALLRPNFSREKVAHTQSLETHLQHLVKHIKKYDGEEFDIQEYFFRYTVDTATEFLFGHSLFGLMDSSIGLSPPSGTFEGDFYRSFTRAQEICASRAWAQNLYMLIHPSDFKSCNKVVHDFAKYYIDLALNLSASELEQKSEDGYIFLYELVKEVRDPTVLRDQLLNIMIAGRDTTAGLLSMFFYELSRNPEIFHKLKQAIYEDFGTSEACNPSDITFSSLKKCEYLKWCINETLRLYPNVPINFRCATKNTTLPKGGGADEQSPILVEKGTVVAYVIAATHTDPDHYGKDATVFRPERWGEDLKPGWAYLPFNGGPRVCLGQQFALTEASYTIVRLVQLFPNLFSADKAKEYPPPLQAQLTISLSEGAYVRMY